MKNKKHIEESKVKMRLNSWTKKGFKPSMLGKKHSEETRKKMSLSHIGKIMSIKSRKKMSVSMKGRKAWNKGQKMPKSMGKKISIINKGRRWKHNLISKKKISASKQGIKIEDWQNFIYMSPYDKNFNNKFKRLIRKRDNYICICCGIHKEKLKRTLDVHHINYDKQLTIKENCVSLCINCHMKTNANRKYWTIFFQSLLSEKYGYKYDEGKIILNIKKEDVLNV